MKILVKSTYDADRGTERLGGQVVAEASLDGTRATVGTSDTAPDAADLGAIDLTLGTIDESNTLAKSRLAIFVSASEQICTDTTRISTSRRRIWCVLSQPALDLSVEGTISSGMLKVYMALKRGQPAVEEKRDTETLYAGWIFHFFSLRSARQAGCLSVNYILG